MVFLQYDRVVFDKLPNRTHEQEIHTMRNILTGICLATLLCCHANAASLAWHSMSSEDVTVQASAADAVTVNAPRFSSSLLLESNARPVVSGGLVRTSFACTQKRVVLDQGIEGAFDAFLVFLDAEGNELVGTRIGALAPTEIGVANTIELKGLIPDNGAAVKTVVSSTLRILEMALGPVEWNIRSPGEMTKTLYDFDGDDPLADIEFTRCKIKEVVDSEAFDSKALDLRPRRGNSGIRFRLPTEAADFDLLVFDMASKSNFDWKFIAIFEGGGARYEQPLSLGSGDTSPMEVDLRAVREELGVKHVEKCTIYFHALPKDYEFELDNVRLETAVETEEEDLNIRRLFSFERPSSRGKAAGNRIRRIALSTNFATHGQTSLEVEFMKGDDSYITLPIPYDWSEYDFFKLDIRNNSDKGAFFYFYLRDGFGKKYKPRLEIGALAEETVEFPISVLSRHVDVEALEMLKIFFWGAKDDCALLFDNIRLAKGKGGNAGFETSVAGEWTILTPKSDVTPPQASDTQQAAGWIPYSENYMVRLYPGAVPTEKQLATPIRAVLAQDEFEPFIIGLWALDDIVIESVSVSTLGSGAGAALGNLNIRFAQPVTAQVGPDFAKTAMKHFLDLVPFYQSDFSFEITKNHSGLLWGTVHAPAGQGPGVYTGEITVKAKGRPAQSLPLTVKVLPFTLEKPKGKTFSMLFTYEFMRMNYKPVVDWPELIERGKREVLDMKNHGMNALSPHSGHHIKEKDGHPFVADLLQSLREAKEQGMMGPFVWFCGPQIFTTKAKLENPYTRFDPRKHLAWLRRMIEYVEPICEAEGLPPVYWLVADEPNQPERHAIARRALRAAKEAGAHTAQTCNKVSIENLAEFSDLIITGFGDLSSEFVEEHRKAGRLLWSYDNSSIFDIHEGRTRFLYGYLGWRKGLDGVSAWTYPHHLSGFRKNAVVGNARAPEYDSKGFPVDNIVWEMVREGIDDYRYIQTMCSATRRTGKPDSAAPILTELRKLSPSIHTYKFNDTKTGENLYENFMTPGQFSAYRRRMAEVILKAGN